MDILGVFTLVASKNSTRAGSRAGSARLDSDSKKLGSARARLVKNRHVTTSTLRLRESVALLISPRRFRQKS